MSVAQRRAWDLEQLAAGPSGLFNEALAFRIYGALGVETLGRGLRTVSHRHEALRTCFANDAEGGVVQHVINNVPVPMNVIDLREVKGAERASRAAAVVQAEARWPLNLARGPVMRATVVRLDPEEHVLLFVVHKLAIDDASVRVLIDELGVAYDAYMHGEKPVLPTPTMQPADYALWERQWLQGGECRRQLAYWKDRIGASRPGPQLPKPQRAYARDKGVPTLEGTGVPVVVSREVMAQLRDLGRRASSSLSGALMAALQLLLFRWTGQDDILVGVPSAGRMGAGGGRAVGRFTNITVIRGDLSGSPPFSELLTRMHNVVCEARAHQELPFERLLDELQLDGNGSRNSLFDVFLEVRPFLPELKLAGLAVLEYEAVALKALHPLSLQIEDGDLVRLRFVFRRDSFQEPLIQTFAQQFRFLLEQIVVAPQRSVLSYSLITPESKAVLPNPTSPIHEPSYEPIPSLIAQWAERAPAQVAVRWNNRFLSYKELTEAARGIAWRLAARGLEHGDVVGITGAQGFDLISSILAVLGSGGVLLTIDPRLPVRRQRIMLQEAAARFLLLASPTNERVFRGLDLQVLEAYRPERPEPVEAFPRLSSEDPAYIFFTSGSTGVPKGVLGCHKGLSHFLQWQRETFSIGCRDRCAQLTNLSFDVLLRAILLPLTSGGTLCLPEGLDDLSAERVFRWIEREGVTLLHTVPSLAQAWLANLPAGLKVHSLRHVFFAGEPLTDVLVRRWRETCPTATIINLYGPTETTLAKCFYVVPEQMGVGPQPIGWPLPETQVLVLREGNRMCGIGEPGEIVIRTPFCTRGYINDPKGNRARFLANPFRNDKRDLLYRSGDRGRYHWDGMLDILGRLDDHVKINGVRVDPAEVTSILSTHPGVEACVVLSCEDEKPTKYLVAYVVRSNTEAPSASDLRSFLWNELPATIIPRMFIFLDALPLNASGKVDRRALPPPETARSRPASRKPLSSVEKRLARIWGDVLHTQSVDAHDNFFELGGDSLSIVEVVLKAELAGLRLSPSQIYGHPTIAQLAAVLSPGACATEHRGEAWGHGEQRRLNKSRPERWQTPRAAGVCQPRTNGTATDGLMTLAEAASRRRMSTAIPVSYAEDRFFQRWAKERTPSFGRTLWSGFELQGALNHTTLLQSLKQVTDRHEGLRARYYLEEGLVKKVISVRPRQLLELADVPGIAKREREEAAWRWVAKKAQRYFDITRECFRASLLDLGDRRYVLLLVFDHIVSDAASREIFFSDLVDCYIALSEGRSPNLPKPNVSYLDYAYWERNCPTGPALAEGLAFWKNYLAGSQPLSRKLTTDHPRAVLDAKRREQPLGASFPAGRVAWSVPPDLLPALRTLASRRNTTLFTVLYTVITCLLHRYTRMADITICSLNDMRSHVAELARVIGPCGNRVLLRLDVSGNPTFRQLLSRAHTEVFRLLSRPSFPLLPVYYPTFNDMFRVELNVTRAARPADWPGFHVTPIPVSQIEPYMKSPTTHMDIVFNVDVAAGRVITGSILYNAELWEPQRITNVASDLIEVLHRIAAQPDIRVRALPASAFDPPGSS